MKINTVNVAVANNETVFSMISFESWNEDEQGNQEAEARFVELAKQEGIEEKYIEEAVENGIFDSGSKVILLVHST